MSRILIVDDDTQILDITGQILESQGYEVTPRSSPEEAIGLLKKNAHAFDLILMDWKLRAAIDGDIVLKVVKHVFPAFQTPVIFITAFTHISSKYLMRLGAFDTLSKPFTAEQLLDAVDRALKKKPAENPHERAPTYLASCELKKQELAKKIVDAITASRSLKDAALLLGCSRMTLYRWLSKTGLHSFLIDKEP